MTIKDNVQEVIDQLMSQKLDPIQINGMLHALSLQIYPDGLRLAYIAVDELNEQDVNANAMTKAAFDQLVQNIRATGAPESIPLVVKAEKGYDIISGHHRTRASREAKLKYILCLAFDSLSRAQVHSKQLSHNSIAGKSDPQIVKIIWDRIDSVQERLAAFIDPKMFDALPQPVSFKPIDVDMGKLSKTVMFVFLPTQGMDFDAAVDQLMPKGNLDKVYIAERTGFEGWIEAYKRVREDLEIVNASTAVLEMARLALERLEQIKAGGK